MKIYFSIVDIKHIDCKTVTGSLNSQIKRCKSAKDVKRLLESRKATFEIWLTFQYKWTVSLKNTVYLH